MRARVPDMVESDPFLRVRNRPSAHDANNRSFVRYPREEPPHFRCKSCVAGIFFDSDQGSIEVGEKRNFPRWANFPRNSIPAFPKMMRFAILRFCFPHALVIKSLKVRTAKVS